MPEIKFVKATETSENFGKLETLFNDSFPPEERPLTMREFIAFSERYEFMKVAEILIDDSFRGFIVYAETEDYVYVPLVAVEPGERGKGYGSMILEKFFGSYSKPVIGIIEKPMESAANNTQRLRRRVFYERLGTYISDIEFEDRGVTYLLASSVKNENLEKYFYEYAELTKNMLDEFRKDNP